MNGEYEFVSGGEACAICLALDGAECDTLPHENCLCQIVPKERACEVNYSFSGTNRYGDGHYDSFVGGEITVVCPDGTEVGESFEFNLGPYAGTGRDSMDIAIEVFEAEAEALCAQCREEEPFLCC